MPLNLSCTGGKKAKCTARQSSPTIIVRNCKALASVYLYVVNGGGCPGGGRCALRHQSYTLHIQNLQKKSIVYEIKLLRWATLSLSTSMTGLFMSFQGISSRAERITTSEKSAVLIES